MRGPTWRAIASLGNFFRGPLSEGPNFCKFYIMPTTNFRNGRVNKSCARESQLVVADSFWHYKLNFLYLVIKPNAQENQQQHFIRTKWIHYDFCIIMHRNREKRMHRTGALLWLWFHWVAGLLEPQTAPWRLFCHLLEGPTIALRAGPSPRNSNTAPLCHPLQLSNGFLVLVQIDCYTAKKQAFRRNFRASANAEHELPFSTLTLNWHLLKLSWTVVLTCV